MSFISKVLDALIGIFKKAKEDLAKITVFIVKDIQPVLFSPTADVLASIMDAITKSQLPTEILEQVKKYVPIFLTTEGIVQSLTPDSTEDEVKAALDKMLAQFPNFTPAQRAQYWTELAAKLYAFIHELHDGEKITFGEAASIVEAAYQAYLKTEGK